MFDIGWTEMLVVACVAIIVVGPKDLPGMLRTIGKTVAKVRRMAGDFQQQFDDALKEAEVSELKNLSPTNMLKSPLDDINASAEDMLEDIKSEAAVTQEPKRPFETQASPDQNVADQEAEAKPKTKARSKADTASKVNSKSNKNATSSRGSRAVSKKTASKSTTERTKAYPKTSRRTSANKAKSTATSKADNSA